MFEKYPGFIALIILFKLTIPNISPSPLFRTSNFLDYLLMTIKTIK